MTRVPLPARGLLTHLHTHGLLTDAELTRLLTELGELLVRGALAHDLAEFGDALGGGGVGCPRYGLSAGAGHRAAAGEQGQADVEERAGDAAGFFERLHGCVPGKVAHESTRAGEESGPADRADGVE
jgi:hypothetical protein